MKEYFQKKRLVLGKMCKKNYVENDNLFSYWVFYFLASETLISTTAVFQPNVYFQKVIFAS